MTKSQDTTGHSLPQQQWKHPDLLQLAPSASRTSCADLQFYGMPNFHNIKENREGNQDRAGRKALWKRLREFEASLEDVQGKRPSSSSEVDRSSDNWIHERLLLFNSLVSDFKIVSHKMDMEILLDQQVSNHQSSITRDDIARKLLLIQFKLVYLVYICDPELHSDLMMSSHSSSSPFSSHRYIAKDAEVINPISLSNVLDLISFTLNAAAPDISENSVENGSSGSGKINLIISTLRKTVLFYDTNTLILHCQAWFPAPKEYHEFMQGLFQAYSEENVWIGNEILLQHVLKEEKRNKKLIGKLLERHVESGASSSEGGRYNRLLGKLLIAASSTTKSRSRPNHFRPLDLRPLHLITDRLFQASTCASTTKSPAFVNDQLLDCLLKSLDFHLHTQYSNNQLHHHTPSTMHSVSPLLIQVQDTLASLISIHHLPASGDILWHLLFKHLYSKNIMAHKKSLHTLLDFYCRQNRQCEAVSKYKSVLALLVRPVMKGRARWGRGGGLVIEDQVHEWQDWWKACCIRNNCSLILPTL